MALDQVGVEAVVKGFDNYVKQMRQLVTETQKASGGLQGAATQSQAAGSSFKSSAAQVAKLGAAFIGVTAGINGIQAGFRNTIGAAISFESSFAGVRKTVNASEAEFAALAQGFRNLAKEIPINVNELNRIGEAAGQLGIKKENILEFTRTIADLGVTTNLSTDQAATALARLANITSLPQSQFSNLGSTIVALGNNFATTEAEITEFGLRIAGAGTQVGLSEAEILAFGAALSSVGIAAEAGGTAISRVFVEINNAVVSGGEKLEEFARVAGLSASEFQRLFNEDAAMATTAFIEGLGRVSAAGENVFEVLEKLDLDDIRVRDALLRAANAGDLLRNAIELANGAFEENTALAVEAEQRYATTASQIQILKNNLTDLGISIGTAVLPAINDVTGALTSMVTSAREGEGAFGAIADILPSLAAVLGAIVAIKVAKYLLDLAQAARTAAMGVSAAQLSMGGFVAAFIALDAGLRAITGDGLMERFVGLLDGADEAAKRAARSMDDFNLSLKRGDTGLEAGLDLINQAFGRLSNHLDDVRTKQQNLATVIPGVETSFRRQGEAVGFALKAMQDAGVPAAELLRILGESRVEALGYAQSLGLTEEQARGLVGSFNDAATAQFAYKDAAAEASPVISDIEQDLRATKQELVGISQSGGPAAQAISDAGDAAGEAEDPLSEFAAAIEGAATATDTLRKNLSILTEQYLLDEETLQRTLDLAEIDLAIAQLRAKGVENLTDAEKEYLEVLEGRKEALEGANEVERAAIDLLTKTGEALVTFGATDTSGIANIFQVFKDNQVPLEDANTILQGILTAFQTVDTTQSIGQFQALYDQLVTLYGKEFADKVFEELGPTLSAKFASAEPEVQAAAQRLGAVIPPSARIGVESKLAEIDAANDAIANQVKAGTDKATAAGETVGAAVPPGVASGVSGAGDSGISDAVKSKVEMAGPEAEAAGVTVGGQAAAGIGAGLSSYDFSSIIAGIKNQILGSFAFLFQMKSPSKLMADEVGKPLVEGIALGIAYGKTSIQEAIKLLSDYTQTELMQVLDRINQAIAQNIKARNYALESGNQVMADIFAKQAVMVQDNLENLVSALGEMGEAGAEALKALVNQMDKLQTELASNLKEGITLTHDETYEMLQNLKYDILNSGLPDDMKLQAEAVIDGWIEGLRDGVGVANSEIIAFLQGLQQTIMSNVLTVTPTVTTNPDGSVTVSYGGGGITPAVGGQLTPGTGGGGGGGGSGGGSGPSQWQLLTSPVGGITATGNEFRYNQQTGEYEPIPAGQKIPQGTAYWFYGPMQTFDPIGPYYTQVGSITAPSGKKVKIYQHANGTIGYFDEDDPFKFYAYYGAYTDFDGQTVQPGYGAGSQAGNSWNNSPFIGPASLDVGTPMVKKDGLAYIHAGEAVIPAALNPFAQVMAPLDTMGTSIGDTSITLDFRGASFGGDAYDTGEAVRQVVRDELASQIGPGAFDAGIRTYR